MSEGNGVDLGRIASMLENVIVAQEAARVSQEAMRRELKGDIAALRQDHGRKIDDLSGQVTSLRQTLTEYHSAVLGHGILISELEARVRRIENHLDLPSVA